MTIDQVVFRENTEGMYGGVEFFPLPESVYTALCANPKMKPWKDKGLDNVALSTRIVSVQGCTNICKQAFEYAKKTGRKRVTLVEKPNVLRETGGLMTRIFREVAKDYPDIWADEANIDAICMWMFKNPQDYSVLVAENMFGDIVSDLCAGLVGGLGFAPSANLGDKYAVFEPTHGSAPKYAGQHKVNPIAMLLTAKLMFDWLKETKWRRVSKPPSPASSRKAKSAPTTWAAMILRSTSQKPLPITPGSARGSRVGFGALAETAFLDRLDSGAARSSNEVT